MHTFLSARLFVLRCYTLLFCSSVYFYAMGGTTKQGAADFELYLGI